MKRIGLVWVCLVACGPNVGTDDDGADAGGSAESSGAATTSATSSMTTETVTSAGTTAGTTATTVTTSSATQSSGESGDTTTAGSTTGSGPECTDASDCELFSTCCDCEALPVGDVGVDNCPGIDCEIGACAMWGITEVQCRAGSCT